MAWTKPYPPGGQWTPNPTSDASWIKPFPPGGAWNTQGVDLVRFAEDGRIRITEDGQRYRIIERFSANPWRKTLNPYDPWHPA